MIRASHQRGAVYVELLIVLLPLLVFVLGLMQTAMLYVGNAAVQRAANAAARSAVVVLDDDPRYYDGERRRTLAGSSLRATDPLDAFVASLGAGAAPPIGGGAGGGSQRLQDIRSAAALPLVAISPSLRALIGKESVFRAIGGGRQEGMAAEAALYTRGAVAVTFPTSPGADSLRTSFGLEEDVNVRVSYLAHCGIPLARHILCESVPSIRAGRSFDQLYDLERISSDPRSTPDRIANAVKNLRVRSERIQRWGADELEHAESPWLIDLTALTGARYFVLRAEAMLPNQGASYAYGGAP